MRSEDIEKLGAFYIGKVYDPESRTRGQEPVLYDSKDLVTHAVCVGMTGSGKTGLCLGLIEEAAIDGIPAIVIDPKGDLSNLLLTFPDLKPSDFRPWINEDDARKAGMDPDSFAVAQADLWKKGIESWGQNGDRIRRLRDAADFVLYTPGSNAGQPVSVLRSFDAPAHAIIDDPELLRERISTTTTGLLGMLGITSDPITSREHILLSSILHSAWSEGRSLDIPGLIHAIQKPPFTRLGVMELETVYPSNDRFALAMALNNLVAAPGFHAWMEGDPLDLSAMMHTASGKPRVCIFSIAHLNDAERMFFVSMLLSQTLAWVRSQSGTTSLRALVYMDEIAGYFPPVSNPPSKQPLLTLMKQARAFGVGVVLATQNPVDLDYKGLANAGTWFIGRLQTDRDKQRVLDGLEGAASNSGAGFDRAQVDRLLSSLSSRVFLMNNIHDAGPTVFETRWCLSYLRGPLTRQQIRSLTDSRRAADHSVHDGNSGANEADSAPRITSPASPSVKRVASTENGNSATRPVLPPEVPQFFLPVRNRDAAATMVYRPMLLGTAKVYYSDAKFGIEADLPVCLLARMTTGPVPVDWEEAISTELTEQDVEHLPEEGISFEPLPADASKPRSYDLWKKSLAERLFRTYKLEFFRSMQFRESSKVGEAERDFRLRLQQISRERRDEAVDALRQKFAPKFDTLQERLRRAEQAVEVQKEQASNAKASSAISFGAAILGAFMGKKKLSTGNVGRAASAARGVGRSSKEARDVERAAENVSAIQQRITALEDELQDEIDHLTALNDPLKESLETISLKPKKTNISVRACILVWTPYRVERECDTPAW